MTQNCGRSNRFRKEQETKRTSAEKEGARKELQNGVEAGVAFCLLLKTLFV